MTNIATGCHRFITPQVARSITGNYITSQHRNWWCDVAVVPQISIATGSGQMRAHVSILIMRMRQLRTQMDSFVVIRVAKLFVDYLTIHLLLDVRVHF